MRKIIIIVILLTISQLSMAKSSPESIQTAIKLEKTKGAIYGLKVYKHLIEANPKNLEALQRGSLAAARLVKLQKTKKMQSSFAALAHKYARMAYQLDPRNAQNNYLMALTNGMLALNASITDKVDYAKNIEKYAKKTAALEPNHPYVYHLFGKLYYEMSQLSSIERSVASKLFGSLPKGTLDKSLSYMQKCYDINPSFVVNLSDIALTLHKLGRDEEAKQYLKKAIETKPYYVEDRDVIAAAQSLLRVIE